MVWDQYIASYVRCIGVTYLVSTMYAFNPASRLAQLRRSGTPTVEKERLELS